MLRLPDLNLSSNGLKDEGAKFMAEVIKHNSILTKLDLSDNGIGDQGIKGKDKPYTPTACTGVSVSRRLRTNNPDADGH